MGGLNTKKRKKNVRGAICLRIDEISSLNGKEVLLIYDVMTTGETLESCVWLLLKRGRAIFASAFVLSRLFNG